MKVNTLANLYSRCRLVTISTALTLLILATITAFLTSSCSGKSIAQGDNKKIEWDGKKFTVATMSTIEKKAIWEIRQNGSFDLPVITIIPLDKAESVLKVFYEQSSQKKSEGIFIYSKSFAIPDTPTERRLMTEYLWGRYHDQIWKESESKLIDDLRLLCQSKGIPLYVNLSANLQGEWKRLAPVEIPKGINKSEAVRP